MKISCRRFSTCYRQGRSTPSGSRSSRGEDVVRGANGAFERVCEGMTVVVETKRCQIGTLS